MKEVKVIGAGLAGCEAASYLAKKGYKVKLYEMRPKKMTPAHKTEKFGELVCSNSLRADSLENAVGILKTAFTKRLFTSTFSFAKCPTTAVLPLRQVLSR